ncbi:MAG: hypothetical protein ACYCUX_01050 [Metallibacterium sp.]
MAQGGKAAMFGGAGVGNTYMHPKKKPQHHAMKKAAPAKARSGG